MTPTLAARAIVEKLGIDGALISGSGTMGASMLSSDQRVRRIGRAPSVRRPRSFAMPLVPFETLPDSARVWVFGSDRPLSEEAAANLMKAVEGYLDEWKAHGEPLTAAYEWRFGRLLGIGGDQRPGGASGRPLAGLFPSLPERAAQLGGRPL